MIAWDTNFLVRYLITDDDTGQSEIVFKVLAAEQSKSRPIYITLITLCETVWVLTKIYKFRKTQLIPVLANILEDSNFLLEGIDRFQKALEFYASNKGDFADYLIGLTAKEAVQAQATHTFDKALKSCPLFEVHKSSFLI
jgi:predicted nucleic-acid-binding protein